MAKNDEFDLKNLPIEANDPEISKDDFKFVQSDAKIHDQKFETKPTTFLKDCFKRFCKNKSSVVATFILGFLLILSVIVPLFGKTSEVHETSGSHPDIYYLQPKLFKTGTGFWDGTKKYYNVPVDASDPDQENWWPDDSFKRNAISNREFTKESYINTASNFGKDGYVQFGYFESMPEDYEVDESNQFFGISLTSKQTVKTFDFASSFKVTSFDVYDKAKLLASNEEKKELPEGYDEAKCALYLGFVKDTKSYTVALTEFKTSFDVGGSEAAIDVTAKFDEFYAEVSSENGWTNKVVETPYIMIRLLNENAEEAKNRCALVKSIAFETNSGVSETDNFFKELGFANGTKCMVRSTSDANLWINRCNAKYSRSDIYLSKAVLCSFVYDTYEAALGTDTVDLFKVQLDEYKNKGYLDYFIDYKEVGGRYVVDDFSFKCKILDSDNCPLAEPFTPEDVEIDQSSGLWTKVHCKVLKYKSIYGLKKMPIFILGTDKGGRDMFIYVFEGLRTSLLLGVATTIICFVFGLIWGSICGYFGGTVDLVMERFTDILAGIPWIVVMTLTIIHLGSNFLTFALALCLTGWIGTAATTRTQFYRFRGREYVLASRTLGASHGRLIAKHILPNAMGTIITSAVLMVPSVIFSEATISYLGLGFKNLASLGVILSDNQIELTNHAYLLIFPSIIIALLMISFNLFGNGLRDAVNPSLKGEGE